jgi:DNA repair protein RadC
MIRYQYISERKTNYSAKISNPTEIVPLLRRYKKLKQESFIVITLNSAHEVIAIRMVSVGTLDRTVVHPREVFCDAITDRAAAIVVAHNHPSGSTDPSNEDKKLTMRLRAAGVILGVPMLDHLIIAQGKEYYSFLEQGEFSKEVSPL